MISANFMTDKRLFCVDIRKKRGLKYSFFYIYRAPLSKNDYICAQEL